MTRTLFTFIFVLFAFHQTAVAAANQRACPTSGPISVTIDYGDDFNTNCQLTSAGQIAAFLFQGTTGDQIAIAVKSQWGNGPCIGLYDPTNAKLADTCSSCNYVGCVAYSVGSAFTLATTGQYTIRVHDSGYSKTGTFGVMLECYFPVVTASPLTLGQPSSANTVNGETIDDWSVSGAAGEDLTVQVSSSYGNGPCFSLAGPAGVIVGGVCSSCNYVGCVSYLARGEYTLPANGTYAVRVYSIGYTETGNYSVLGQCLASCPAPGPVFPSVNITLTGCTTACVNGNAFSATLATANLPNKTTELKFGFILPDTTTVPVGDPHTELPPQYTFNGQVLSGPILAAMQRGSWSLCARIVDLAEGETLAASCQPFTLQ